MCYLKHAEQKKRSRSFFLMEDSFFFNSNKLYNSCFITFFFTKSTVAAEMDDDYPLFSTSHFSSMSRSMTPSTWKRLRSRRTRRGCDLNDCVQTGVDVPRHRFITSAGCVAPDADAYDVFKEFFARVLEDQHRLYGEIEKGVRGEFVFFFREGGLWG